MATACSEDGGGEPAGDGPPAAGSRSSAGSSGSAAAGMEAGGKGGAGAPAGGTQGGAGHAGVVISAPGCKPELASIQQTVFASGCALAGCHGAMAPAAALDLASLAASQASLLGVSAALCDGTVRVVPGSARESLLYLKLSGEVPADCGEPMPVGGMLDAAALACVKSWIDGLDPMTTPPVTDPACETCGTGACVDTASNARHCGACGVACPAGAGCEQGACRCSGNAILCDGQCSTTCNCAGEICSGACVDTQADARHCGGCGVVCAAGQRCEAGACKCAQPGVSFAKDVAPILASGCAQNGCHGKTAPKEGLALTSDRAFDALVSVNAAQCNDGRKRVTPGNAGASYLIDKLLGVDMCKGSQMPKAGQSLPPSQLETISAWVCNGALKN